MPNHVMTASYILCCHCFNALRSANESNQNDVWTIQELKCFISTMHGDYTRFFSGTKSGKPNQGVGQGNGAGPKIWVAISSLIFDYVCKQGYVVRFVSSISHNCIHVTGFGFVNNVDLLAANDSIEQTCDQVVQSIQGCLDSWEFSLWVSRGHYWPLKAVGHSLIFNGKGSMEVHYSQRLSNDAYHAGCLWNVATTATLGMP